MSNVQPILQHVFKKRIGESSHIISPSTTTSSKSVQNARVIQQHSVSSTVPCRKYFSSFHLHVLLPLHLKETFRSRRCLFYVLRLQRHSCQQCRFDHNLRQPAHHRKRRAGICFFLFGL